MLDLVVSGLKGDQGFIWWIYHETDERTFGSTG